MSFRNICASITYLGTCSCMMQGSCMALICLLRASGLLSRHPINPSAFSQLFHRTLPNLYHNKPTWNTPLSFHRHFELFLSSCCSPLCPLYHYEGQPTLDRRVGTRTEPLKLPHQRSSHVQHCYAWPQYCYLQHRITLE